MGNILNCRKITKTVPVPPIGTMLLCSGCHSIFIFRGKNTIMCRSCYYAFRRMASNGSYL